GEGEQGDGVGDESDSTVAEAGVDAAGVGGVEGDVAAEVGADAGVAAIAAVQPASLLIDLIADAGQAENARIAGIEAGLARLRGLTGADQPTMPACVPVDLGAVLLGEVVALLADGHGVAGAVGDGGELDVEVGDEDAAAGDIAAAATTGAAVAV